MKKIIIALLLALSSLPLLATNPQPVILTPEPTETDPDDGEKDKDNKGLRSRPAPIFCELDFDNSSITSSSPLVLDATGYEIWAEDGEVCYISSGSAADMFSSLTQLPAGTYLLRLEGSGYRLSGIIEL
jgi:hypothetical protein